MNTLFFQPDDVLFCRDGRPMLGASSGHGDHFPLPHVVDAALHAALHRLSNPQRFPAHRRRQGKKNRPTPASFNSSGEDRFGSLTNAGPFPVAADSFYFPRPRDLGKAETKPTLYPANLDTPTSLPKGLAPVVSSTSASKERPPPWLSLESYQHYLDGNTVQDGFAQSSEFFESDHTIGIGIEADTYATQQGRIYSSSRLRLRAGITLATIAGMETTSHANKDPIAELFPANGRIRLGGESRTCSVSTQEFKQLPLPIGAEPSGNRVKWVLLTPAIFPCIDLQSQPGGWLPNWVRYNKGAYEVQILDGPGENKARRHQRRGTKVETGSRIQAKLVAAIIPSPTVVTGWAVNRWDGYPGGAKSTLLAVPAGSVYYFEAADKDQAKLLANALNWHGSSRVPKTIANRRSGLLGEKGYGIGVCGNW